MKKTESVELRYDALGGDYDRITGPLEWLTAKMRQQTLAHASGEVLEVGVGSGKNLAYYRPDCRVVGIDMSRGQLELAEKRALEQQKVFTPQLGDATNMPFDAGRFDTVVATLVGCVVDDPHALYREMRRVCHPNGRVLFVEHIRPPGALMRAFCRAAGPVAKRKLHCDMNRDSVQYMEEAGLRIADRQNSVWGMFVQLVMIP
ncbi:class I SAM-dependent methyltransferase [Candidatus Uhrbacteria bacterium]|nr:class I SAM-dependent methyltransferase [Candidatus Uhrbacteria bacterium]